MLDIVQILTDPDIFPKALESLCELRYKATAYNRHISYYNEAKSIISNVDQIIPRQVKSCKQFTK